MAILEAILKYENAYKRLFNAKKIKHWNAPSIKHQDLSRHVVSSEINHNIEGEGLMRSVCHSIGHVLGYFWRL